MNKKATELKRILFDIIDNQKKNLTGLVSDPNTDFSRKRKFPYENMILSLLTMEGTSLTNELLRQFGCNTTTATTSAFVQQRKKYFRLHLKNFFMILYHKHIKKIIIKVTDLWLLTARIFKYQQI